MNLDQEAFSIPMSHLAATAISPVAAERIKALASRAIEGAPALTAGEMRELAEAMLEHNARSERQT